MKKGDLFKVPSNLFYPEEIAIFTKKHWCESTDCWIYNFYFPLSGSDLWYTESELIYIKMLKTEE